MVVSDPATDLQIRRLEARDADGLVSLSNEAGWNQIAADWRLMLEQGRGFGIKSSAGQWIGSALLLPLGSNIAWISMVLVTASARRQGQGGHLLRRCLAEAEASSVAVGLDATEFGRPVYADQGFRDVYGLSRWRLKSPACSAASPPHGISLRPAMAGDLARIIKYDGTCTGFARGEILHHLQSRAPELAIVAEGADRRIAGYVLGRNGRTATHIGPAVADAEAVGLALLSRAAAEAQGPLVLDIPDRHHRTRKWLADQGGSAPRTFMRMLRGAHPPLEDVTRVFAIAGPELA